MYVAAQTFWPLSWHNRRNFCGCSITERARQTLSEEAHNGKDIDALVQNVRHKASASIQQRYALMRLLDMPQPLTLDNIYTDVNILEKITGRRRLEVADLLKVSA